MYGNNSKRTFVHDICKLPNHVERGDQPENKGMGGGGGAMFFITLYFITVCLEKVRFPLLLFRSSVFSVSHARFSSKSLLYQKLVSFVHF